MSFVRNVRPLFDTWKYHKWRRYKIYTMDWNLITATICVCVCVHSHGIIWHCHSVSVACPFPICNLNHWMMAELNHWMMAEVEIMRKSLHFYIVTSQIFAHLREWYRVQFVFDFRMWVVISHLLASQLDQYNRMCIVKQTVWRPKMSAAFVRMIFTLWLLLSVDCLFWLFGEEQK